MASSTKQFAQDTADGIQIQLGTVAAPQGTAGALSILIVTKDRSTGTRVEAAGAAVGSAALGIVGRAWETGEKPEAGGELTIEVTLTLSGGGTRTYPGLGEAELVAKIGPRRTTA